MVDRPLLQTLNSVPEHLPPSQSRILNATIHIAGRIIGTRSEFTPKEQVLDPMLVQAASEILLVELRAPSDGDREAEYPQYP